MERKHPLRRHEVERTVEMTGLRIGRRVVNLLGKQYLPIAGEAECEREAMAALARGGRHEARGNDRPAQQRDERQAE